MTHICTVCHLLIMLSDLTWIAHSWILCVGLCFRTHMYTMSSFDHVIRLNMDRTQLGFVCRIVF